MFDFVAHTPLGFWIVASLIIIADSLLFLSPGRVAFVIEKRLNVRLRIVERPFLLRGKMPVITLFTFPLSPFFISSLHATLEGKRKIQQALLKRKKLAKASCRLSYFSFISLLFVIIIGPLVSLQYGIERALLVILPMEYLIALFGAIILHVNRRIYALSGRDIAHISVELAVCPILMVNIIKKISVRQEDVSAIDLLEHFAPDRYELSKRLEEYVEETGA
jgi:hypothetical protein